MRGQHVFWVRFGPKWRLCSRTPDLSSRNSGTLHGPITIYKKKKRVYSWHYSV